MKKRKFRMVVYDQIVRRFEKKFRAANMAQAHKFAEVQTVGLDSGWVQRYDRERLSRNTYIERVEDITDEIV